MAALGNLLGGWSVYQVLEFEEFLIEVHDGGILTVAVILIAKIFSGLHAGVMDGAALVARIGHGSGDADGSDGIETVGILDNLAFQAERLVRLLPTLEGNVGDDSHDLLNLLLAKSLTS